VNSLISVDEEGFNEYHMELKGITFKGEEVEDQTTFDELPEDLQNFYSQINGLTAYQGGIHFRGCAKEPEWGSLHRYWKGDAALYKSYPALTQEDIPFAQDCLGDQFFWRNGNIWALNTETATVEDLEMEFDEFIGEVVENPVEFLSLEPLLHFMDDGNELDPGELLHCEPALTIDVPEDTEYAVTALDIDDRLRWLKDFSTKYSN